MQKIILSLVIPVYNSSRFLKVCLESVARQIHPGVEIVLVNDGSTDSSAQIIEEEIKKHDGEGVFILVNQVNSGPGEARNAGVSVARGEYIGFLDSDDLLCPNYFIKILSIIKEFSPEILQFNVKRIPENGIIDYQKLPECKINSDKAEINLDGYTIFSHSKKPGLYELNQVRLDTFGRGKWFPVSRVFRKYILDINKFPRDRIFYEDILTIPFIFIEERSIYLMDDILICYRDNPLGTTRNHTVENIDSLYELIKKIDKIEKNIALSILKIQVARGIAYFSAELNLKEDRFFTLLSDIDNMRWQYPIVKNMKTVDIIFFIFPRIYAEIEKVRHSTRFIYLNIVNKSAKYRSNA